MLADVPDPEIPVLSILDLGIVRAVHVTADGTVEVGLAPTYSGCPATEVIRRQVSDALNASGFVQQRLFEVLSPPWTSDWITPEGRDKLLAYGIAPPADSVAHPRHLRGSVPIVCPRCRSERTSRVSEFGSTPCKALHRCHECLEPFELFKCI